MEKANNFSLDLYKFFEAKLFKVVPGYIVMDWTLFASMTLEISSFMARKNCFSWKFTRLIILAEQTSLTLFDVSFKGT